MPGRIEDALFPFEDVLPDLEFVPLAARRALDSAGVRITLEGWRSLHVAERRSLVIAGSPEDVDVEEVLECVRGALPPSTRIAPSPDPDPDEPPEALVRALGSARTIDAQRWSNLSALDRFALVHGYRRAVAKGSPAQLEAIFDAVVHGVVLTPSRGIELDALTPRLGVPRGGSPVPGQYQPPGAYSMGTPAPKSPLANRRSPAPSATEREPAPATDPLFGTGQRPLTPGFAPRSTMAYDTSLLANALAAKSEPGRDAPREAGGRAGDGREVIGRMIDAGGRLGDAREAGGKRDAGGRVAESPRTERAERDAPRTISTHIDERGEVHMIPVGDKQKTVRRAVARGSVKMRRETAEMVARGQAPKGEVLATARIAGILAAKRTPELIPLCHHVALTRVAIELDVLPAEGRIDVTAIAEAVDRTGVEMEAIVAVTVASLTLYDMLKGVDREIEITSVHLVEKIGGKTGHWVRST